MIEERKAYFREYYRKNRERILANRKYKYTEEKAEYQKEYYEENKDELKVKMREYKQKNKDKWNNFQNLYKKIKYWESKVSTQPEDIEAVNKLNSLLEEKENNKK